jgi:hypothetical protein
MPSLYLYLIGGAALIAVGFGGGFSLEQHLSQNEIATLSGNLATARGNETTLTSAVKACNLSVDDIKNAGDKLTAEAQALVDELNLERAKYATAITAVQSIKSTDEKCPVADAIIQAGFAQ